MTATSHAITGAFVATLIKEPLAALPLAFLSHFLLDLMPHIGLDEYGGHLKKKALFHRILFIDAILLAAFFGFLISVNVGWLIFAGAIVSGMPDIGWAYRYTVQEKAGSFTPKPMGWFSRVHSKIQWHQTLKGAFFEIPFTIAVFILFVVQL